MRSMVTSAVTILLLLATVFLVIAALGKLPLWPSVLCILILLFLQHSAGH